MSKELTSRLIVVRDYEELSREAARLVARRLLERPDLVLALPTGDTPIGMYRELVRLHREGLVDFSRATTFNLDEYLGIPPDHPQSFKSYMRQHLWDHVNLRKENVHIPSSLPKNPDQECAHYESLIQEAGGIDLAVLGLGTNGHIGFNEPGTPFESLTHVAELSEETRKREAQAFGGLEHVPTQAITMGIKTIMLAREVLLLVSGEEKREALFRALTGAISLEVPGSVLQLHHALTVLSDRAAASLLK